MRWSKRYIITTRRLVMYCIFEVQGTTWPKFRFEREYSVSRFLKEIINFRKCMINATNHQPPPHFPMSIYRVSEQSFL